MHKIPRRGYTDHISRHSAENICHAFDYAKHIGMPLNRYVVINFAKKFSKEPSTIFAHIRDKFRDWLSYAYKKAGVQSPPPAYVYTLESPNGHNHVNWAVHVPPLLQDEFPEKIVEWVRKANPEARSFDIKIQDVDPHTDKTLAKYVLKGIDKAYIRYLHLDGVAEPQGRIWGRRATASPSIGRTARKTAGFIPRLHRHEWKNRKAA